MTDPTSPDPAPAPVPGPAVEARAERQMQRSPWLSPRVLGVVVGVSVLALVSGLGLLITLREGTNLDLDTSWMEEVLDNRVGPAIALALLFDNVGGHVIGVFVVPIAIALALLLTKRRWGALYFVLACALSAGFVQVLKKLFGRDRPLDILVVSDYGSFPSGHTANAATLAVALGLVLQRTWMWVLGIVWSIGMLLSRTYLGAHWLTDTLGGLLVGAAAAVILWALFARRLRVERELVAPRQTRPAQGRLAPPQA